MRKRILAGLAIGAFGMACFYGGRVLATGAPTQTPLVYAGTITGADGKPLAAATDVSVAFYDAAVAGNQVCKAETVLSDAATGRFSVVLPPACADAAHAKTDLWSEAAVGPNKTLLPRQHVGAVPYALEADSAKIAKGVQCTGCVNVDAMLFDKDVDLGGKTLMAGKIDFGPQAGDELTGAQVKTLTGGGNADALHTHSGLGGGGGQVIKFKGVTAKTLDGAQGLPAMNAACAAEYGAARTCRTTWLNQLFPAPNPIASAWVIFDGPFFANPGSGDSFLVDGADANTSGAALGFMCSGIYTPYATLSNSGLALQPGGKFAYSPCKNPISIACCGP